MKQAGGGSDRHEMTDALGSGPSPRVVDLRGRNMPVPEQVFHLDDVHRRNRGAM